MIESFAKEIFNTFSVDHFVNPFSRVSVVLAPYLLRTSFESSLYIFWIICRILKKRHLHEKTFSFEDCICGKNTENESINYYKYRSIL
jgi:hypothetical protein